MIVGSTPVESARPAATPMTLASPRLIRKRWFISVSLVRVSSGNRQRRRGRNQQKRGNERAGENGGSLTGRSERNEHWISPCIYRDRPDHRADANINAGGVPIRKRAYFTVARYRAWRRLPANIAACW